MVVKHLPNMHESLSLIPHYCDLKKSVEGAKESFFLFVLRNHFIGACMPGYSEGKTSTSLPAAVPESLNSVTRVNKGRSPWRITFENHTNV